MRDYKSQYSKNKKRVQISILFLFYERVWANLYRQNFSYSLVSIGIICYNKNMVNKVVSEKLKTLPNDPGVYIMLDDAGEIIYVGKAKVLKNRVRQYFQNSEKPVKVQAMVSKIADFRYIITKSEVDALLLENNLIEVVGRKDAPGKPLLFGTTDEFLKRFRLESLDQLPDYETLLESIKLINAKDEVQKGIYNEFEIPDEEADIELPEEEVPEFLSGETDLKKVE